MNLRKHAAVMALILLATGQMDATTFVAVYSRGTVTVGGDTLVRAASTPTEGSRQVHHCKIQTSPKYLLLELGFWSILRIRKNGGEISEYSKLEDVMRPILEAGKSPEETFRLLSAAAHAYMKKGFEGKEGEIKTARAAFALLWYTPGVLHERRLDGPEIIRQDRNVWNYGLADAWKNQPSVPVIDPYLATNKYIVDLLQKQAVITPATVGPPFPIVSFSEAGGAKWVGDASYCRGH